MSRIKIAMLVLGGLAVIGVGTKPPSTPTSAPAPHAETRPGYDYEAERIRSLGHQMGWSDIKIASDLNFWRGPMLPVLEKQAKEKAEAEFAAWDARGRIETAQKDVFDARQNLIDTKRRLLAH